jgi:GLPGLI family protein
MRIIAFLLILNLLSPGNSIAQTYNDGTIEYDIILDGLRDSNAIRIFKNAYMVLYIRGHQTRSELHTSMGITTTIYDEKNGGAVILNEYGNQRVMLRLSSDQYKLVNKKYRDVSIELLKDTKNVNGYICKSASIKIKGGLGYLVYYSPVLKFQTLYNGLPVVMDGFPMEYESEIEGMKVIYKVRKISLDAVTANLFDLPSSGYREVKFEEIYKP